MRDTCWGDSLKSLKRGSQEAEPRGQLTAAAR
jgi:hypothetical protein